MADEATVMALNIREMLFSISRSLVSGRQTKFQSQKKAIILLLRVMIEKFPEKYCFPCLFWFLQLKFRLRNFDMFVGCLYHLNL